MELLETMHKNICKLQEVGLILNEQKSEGRKEVDVDAYEILLNASVTYLMIVKDELEKLI